MKSFFISSTFKDMQAERDLLHQSVFPKIRRKLKKYNEDIQELDLRWGVDTSLMSEEESGQHVIECCVDSIDRCRPYMIVLVGERYGWIPNTEVLSNMHDDRITECYKEPISITQMEIMYGVLDQNNYDRCIFCFRDEHFSEQLPDNLRHIYQAESELHAQKLADLKQTIREAKGAKIIEYSSEWDEEHLRITNLDIFEERISECLWDMLEKDVATRGIISPEEQILEQAGMTAKRYVSTYIPRANINEAGTLNGRGAVWYYGAGGCGKSAFLSNIYSGATAVDNHAFIYFCGNENCGQVDTFLNTFLYWLKKENGEEFTAEDRTSYRSVKLQEILRLLKMPRTCDRMIIIDAVDQMEEDILDFLIHIRKAVIRETVGLHTFGMVVSSLDSYYLTKSGKIKIGEFSSWKIGEINAAEIIAVSQLHAKQRGKHLDARVQKAIREKASCGNPYYLSLLLQQLFMMDGEDFKKADELAPGMEGLSLYMEQFVQRMPNDLNEMTIDTLQNTINKLKRKTKDITGGWERIDPMDIFSLFAVAKDGLTLGELEDITDMEQLLLFPVEIQRVLTLLYDAFCESSSGRWNYSHRLMRKNLLAHMSEEQYRKAALLLCKYAKANNRHSEAFYYALRGGNMEEICAAMQGIRALKSDEQKLFLSVYRTYLLETKSPIDFKALNLSGDDYSWFISKLIVSEPDQALQQYDYWREILTEAKTKSKSLNMAYDLQLAETIFHIYDEYKADYLAEIDKTEELFLKQDPIEEHDVIFYTEMLLTALAEFRCRSNYSFLEKKLSRLLEQEDAVKYIAEHESTLRTLKKILTNWSDTSQKQGNEKAASINVFLCLVDSLRAMIHKDAWEEYTLLEQKTERAITAVILAAACELNNLGKYTDAFNALKKLDGWMKARIENAPTIQDRLLYMSCLSLKMGCLKAESARKQLKPYQQQAELLCEMIRIPFFKARRADSYYMESYILDKEKRAGKADWNADNRYRISFREAINLYDELLEGKTDDEKNLNFLEDAAYLRYRRINLRLENDIWNWKADHSVNIGEKPAWFEEMMETDLRRMTEAEHLLWQKNPGRGPYYLAWSLLYGVQYYDRHQEYDKMMKWCDALLSLMEKIEAEEPAKQQLSKLTFYIELAEAMERHHNLQHLPALTERAGRLIEDVEKKTTKHMDKVNRFKVRNWLLILKGKLFADFEEAKEHYQAGIEIGLSFEKDDQYLLSDLHQTLGELCCEKGDIEQAIHYLEKSQETWPKINSIWISTNESKVQQVFRYLKGQRLLAQIKKDRFTLNQIIWRYKVMIEERTTYKETARRYLLLEEVTKVKEIYETCFPDKPISEDLHYILLMTEPERKKDNWNKLIERENWALRMLAEWEKEHVSDEKNEEYYDKYLTKIKKVSEIQEELRKNVVLKSEDDKQLFKRQMKNLEKGTRCSWLMEQYKAALYRESTFLLQFEHRKEWMEEFYSPGFCWNHCQTLIEKREIVPYHNRQVQICWIEIMDYGADTCKRFYQQTGDVEWFFSAIDIYHEHRSYIRKIMIDHPDDLDWNMEQIHRVYTKEQRIYMEIWKSGQAEEERWLHQFLDNVMYQVQMKIRVDPKYYQDTLERLYELQASSLKNQAAIQKAIDLVTSTQSGGNDNFYFYMQKAARDLSADAGIEKVTDYIEQLKKKNE